MKKLNRSWAIVGALFAASLLPSCGNDVGRYQLQISPSENYSMLDTRTGELWLLARDPESGVRLWEKRLEPPK